MELGRIFAPVERQYSGINFKAFIWHAFFLALTATFTQVNTVISSLILSAGGGNIQLGILTAITVGIPPLTKLLFAGFLHTRSKKKPWLLYGINLRVLALAGIGTVLLLSQQKSVSSRIIPLVFLLLLIFSISGSFSGISYTDILGKTLNVNVRRRFFIIRQIFQISGLLISALIVRQILKISSYPQNYVLLFYAASLLLLIGSGGFWLLREERLPGDKKNIPFRELMRLLPQTIRQDVNLRRFIIFQNLTGFGLMLFPFYIGFAKHQFGLTKEEVGNYLLFQIFGSLLATALWGWLSKLKGYKGILSGCIFTSSLLPYYTIWAGHQNISWYLLVFFFSGFAISARSIAFEAVLLEITTDENRALYSGITGAANLTVAFIPLLSGLLIHSLGFIPVFALSPLMILAAYPVLNKIRIH